MKLLILSNRYYFIALLIVSIIGGVSSYFLIGSIINREFNKKLYAEKNQLIYELHEFDELLNTLYLNIGDRITLQKVDQDPKIHTNIKDTLLFDFYENKESNFRKITFSEQVKGDFYKITISKPLLSSEDMIQVVTKIVAIITLLFFVTMLLLNNIISKKVWKPFYNTLTRINFFNVVDPKPLTFSKTKVREFRELNSTIEVMINQVVKDYKNLKKSTENTSHEIQTPLAIIKNKIEILMQDDQLSEYHLNILNQVHDFVRRLSKLNQNLSLLSKIDNNQFIEAIPIPIGEYLKKRVEDVEELILMKNISVILNLNENPIIKLDETLAYLLFNNLLNNAIKHNINGGKLILTLSNTHFSIKNTGKPLKIFPEELFKRFKKQGNLPNSTGLGLSIVYSITSYYNFSITYNNEDVWHVIELKF
ncbi:sensor histidine kinase [Aquimarina longa]|uniref:sensor histidine kinase n=1 Tax=Aquimarina longa TaxID=1080221 RepID=UPI00078516CB|nr:HAMP domain-containing sensor histidine kinase [Aquimarina longa]